MKTMTCRQLGGPCDLPLSGDSGDEIIKAQDRHLRRLLPPKTPSTNLAVRCSRISPSHSHHRVTSSHPIGPYVRVNPRRSARELNQGEKS